MSLSLALKPSLVRLVTSYTHRQPTKPFASLLGYSLHFANPPPLLASYPFSTTGPFLAKKSPSSRDPSSNTSPQESFDASRIEKDMASGVTRLRMEVKTLVNRVGRLTPAYLDGVRVELEGGVRSPIEGLAQVIVLDPSTLSVVPYDSSHSKLIEKSLYDSQQLNLSPNLQSDGSILLAIPKLTAESRQTLVKKAGQVCEQARGVVRQARQTAQKASRKDLDTNLITKDDFKSNNKVLDDITKAHTKLIDDVENKAKRVLLDV